MLCKWLLVYDKLVLFWNFLKKKKEKKFFLMFLFHSLLVESMDMEPVEMEGRLHAHILSLCVLNK